jgi:photosystem II stability/assembly factor-like uncharacterized protein
MDISLLILFFAFLISCNRKEEPSLLNNNWQVIYQNTDLDLFSIKFIDENNGYVLAGLSALHTTPNWELILTTTNGGNQWAIDTCYFPMENDPVSDIYPLGNRSLLAIGSHVYKSDDNGKNWKDISTHFVSSNRIGDLYVIDSTTWIVAKGVDIFMTKDVGQSWQTVFQTDFMGVFEKFSFPSPTIGYANIGVMDLDHNQNAGQIIKTVDGGQSWTNLKSEPWNSDGVSIPYITTIQFITDYIGYISTFSKDKLYKTVDGGNNWTTVQNNNALNVYTLLYFIDEEKGYYSDGKNIYATKDGGSAWLIDNYDINEKSNILTWTFLKTGVGFALTEDHQIIKRNN